MIRNRNLGSTSHRPLNDPVVVRGPAAQITPQPPASTAEAALALVEVALMNDAPRAMRSVMTGFHTAHRTAADVGKGTIERTDVRDGTTAAPLARRSPAVGNLVMSPEVDHATVAVLAHDPDHDLVDSEAAVSARHLAAVVTGLVHVVQMA